MRLRNEKKYVGILLDKKKRPAKDDGMKNVCSYSNSFENLAKISIFEVNFTSIVFYLRTCVCVL